VNVLVLHGPNLNLLGEREPEIYGHTTLAQLDEQVQARGEELGLVVRTFQSNHEGALIDQLHAERTWMDALVINAGALTHTSYALRDAIAAVAVRAIEVHLSDVKSREAWRRRSVFEDVVEAQISGKGVGSYLEALERLAGAGRRPGRERRAAGPSQRKTIGRGERPRLGPDSPGRPASGAPVKRPKAPRKTLGRAGPAAVQVRDGEIRRSDVSTRVAECLRGKLPLRALSDWARGRYLAVQRGQARYEPGADEVLEGALLKLTVAPQSRATDDHALIELLARLSR
jgi:3-dehydroquinate dehydratase-2